MEYIYHSMKDFILSISLNDKSFFFNNSKKKKSLKMQVVANLQTHNNYIIIACQPNLTIANTTSSFELKHTKVIISFLIPMKWSEPI